MGLYKPCYSVSGEAVEVAVLGLYDEAAAIVLAAKPGNPGMDDLMGEPFLEDNDADGIGERVRPETTASIKCKAKFGSFEEQNQTPSGNEPESFLTLTIATSELSKAGLLTAGQVGIRPNDRLLRLQSKTGVVRVDFEAAGRSGVHVVEVRPGATGSGIYKIMLEQRQPAQS